MNTSEAYQSGYTTLEIDVADWTFTAVVPAMVSRADDDDTMVEGEVIADFELRIAQWCCERDDLPGAALKFVRHTLGLKQVELSNLLGYQAETLSRWENGDRPVPRLVRVVLASMIADRLTGADETMTLLRGAHDPPSRRIELGRFQLRRPGAVLAPIADDAVGE